MSTAAIEVPSTPTAEIMRALTAELPLNDFGLPQGIYRSDLLPFHLYDPSTHTMPSGDSPTPVHSLIPSVEAVGYNHKHAAQAEVTPEGDTPDEPSVDPFSLLGGQGDGLPDMIMPARVLRPKTEVNTSIIPKGEYRIAGFPAGALKGAFVTLQYDEGFPAFENGSSFWHQLPFEPQDAYGAFERYLLMSFGRRANIEDEDDSGEVAGGTRSIGALIAQLAPTADDIHLLTLSDKLKEYSHLYYWGLRTRSYDLFRVTQHKQQQEIRAIETQDDHYLIARKLRARVETYMNEEEDFFDMMTPKTALDAHKHFTQLERISAGVPAAGPQMKETESGGQSFEVAFQTVAQAHRRDGVDGTLISEEGKILDQALTDPAAVELLQKLIIRTGGG